MKTVRSRHATKVFSPSIVPPMLYDMASGKLYKGKEAEREWKNYLARLRYLKKANRQ